ncbi:hypothetical protein FRC17_003581 [Serendipita sp. 399]|nr:hypothetical protein FRC17_003581 [Serendipita sp. 399]
MERQMDLSRKQLLYVECEGTQDQRLHLQPLQERRAITPALEEGLHATVQPSDTTPAFSQIDPSGSMNNANHLQPMQIALPTGDPSPSGRVPFKLTYYRLTWIFLVSQFGILKGIATYRGANILSASFDLVLGVVVVVVLYIAGLFEEVRPVVWPWFFHQRVPVIHGVLDVTTFLPDFASSLNIHVLHSLHVEHYRFVLHPKHRISADLKTLQDIPKVSRSLRDW